MKIEKLKGNRTKPYRVRVFIGTERKVYYFSNKNEALEFKLRAKREPSLLEQFIRRERKSLGVFGAEYIESCKPNVKPATSIKYSESLRLYLTPQLGNLDLNEIKRLHIEGFKCWLTGLSISQASKVFHLNFLKTLIKNAFELELIPKNPCLGVKGLPRAMPREEYWTEEELSKFVNYHQCNPRIVLYLLGLNCGARLGEILALRKTDIDWNTGRVHIKRSYDQKTKVFGTPKNHKSRVVHLPEEVCDFIRLRLENDMGDYLVPRGLPGLTDPKHASRVLRNDCKAAGVRPIRFHDLRHTWATHFVARTGNALQAQKLLGHSSLEMTARYAHVSGEQLKRTRNVLSIVPGGQENIAKTKPNFENGIKLVSDSIF